MMKSITVVTVVFTTLFASSFSQEKPLGLDISHNITGELCKVNETDTGENVYDDCIPEFHFPTCDENKEFICYNRVNRRDKFYEDKQPYYYIDPKRVLCYDNKMLQDGGGCSSCTPGRFCLSENRCINDDSDYDCADWWTGVAEASA